MRPTLYYGSPKRSPAGVSDEFTWTPSEIPSALLSAVYFKTFDDGAGATADFSKVSRLRVDADGETLIDVDRTQWRAFLASTTSNNYFLNEGVREFIFPLGGLTEDGEDLADRVQVPLGAQVQVTLSVAGFEATDGAMIGFRFSDKVPEFSSRVLRFPMNIPASSTAARFNLPLLPGELMGFAIPTANIKRFRLYLNGEQLMAASCQADLGSANEGDLLVASQLDEIGVLGTGGAQLLPYRTPFWVKLRSGRRITEAGSFIELDTGAGWSTSDQVVLHTLVPQRGRAR